MSRASRACATPPRASVTRTSVSCSKSRYAPRTPTPSALAASPPSPIRLPAISPASGKMRHAALRLRADLGPLRALSWPLRGAAAYRGREAHALPDLQPALRAPDQSGQDHRQVLHFRQPREGAGHDQVQEGGRRRLREDHRLGPESYPPAVKMPSGSRARTVTFGTSTTLLTLKSTATLHST